MNITVTRRIEADPRRLKDAVIERMEKALARYSRQVERVNVTLVDENGPRGGVDKRCQINVVLHGTAEVTASATHENTWAAFSRAIDRVQHIMARRFSRLRTRRLQARGRRRPQPDMQTADPASPPTLLQS